MVGAVIVRDDLTLGEGFHRRRGGAHAEVEALDDARARGADVRGATVYVSLEPCNHTGMTPPCSEALVAAGVSRVVVGTADPNPRTALGGIARLRAAGIAVDLLDDPEARELVEDFAVWVRADRPYVRLKMAMSADGFVAPEPGPHWLTGEAARSYVRDLRTRYDAVMVGAGTLRIDDPQLTVRPPFARARPYVRVVAAGREPVPAGRRVFAEVTGYAPTIVLSPANGAASGDARHGSAPSPEVAVRDLEPGLPLGAEALRVAAGPGGVDLEAALRALRARGVCSVLCEGGPALASRLLEAGLVDRFDRIVAPAELAGPKAVAGLSEGAWAALDGISPDAVQALGEDVLHSVRLT